MPLQPCCRHHRRRTCWRRAHWTDAATRFPVDVMQVLHEQAFCGSFYNLWHVHRARYLLFELHCHFLKGAYFFVNFVCFFLVFCLFLWFLIMCSAYCSSLWFCLLVFASCFLLFAPCFLLPSFCLRCYCFLLSAFSRFCFLLVALGFMLSAFCVLFLLSAFCFLLLCVLDSKQERLQQSYCYYYCYYYCDSY